MTQLQVEKCLAWVIKAAFCKWSIPRITRHRREWVQCGVNDPSPVESILLPDICCALFPQGKSKQKVIYVILILLKSNICRRPKCVAGWVHQHKSLSAFVSSSPIKKNQYQLLWKTLKEHRDHSLVSNVYHSHYYIRDFPAEIFLDSLYGKERALLSLSEAIKIELDLVSGE